MRERLPAAAAASIPGAGQRARWRRALSASAASLALVAHGTAWATCADGSAFPQNGYVIGQAPVQTAANWSPNVFTGTAGSVWVPDNSAHEFNDPNGPLTGGGHNWVFDQGSTLCKVTDTGTDPTKVATGWQIPPNTPTSCVLLPIIKGGRITNIGDIPLQGDVITPTCDPTRLAGQPNAATNNYFNQLGCAISQTENGVDPVTKLPPATDAQHAPSWLFVAGIKGGLFSVRLDNADNTVVGGDAGRTAGVQDYYSQIPEGQKLTNATVSPDGRFAIATSIRRAQPVWACLNPLGDPGDPKKPLKPNFTVPPASTVQCMQVGSNALAVDLTTEFGPDYQPYFGGQRVVNSFNAQPGGTAVSAWPQCITQGTNLTIAGAFAAKSANHCGNASSNFGFTSALITQPQALIRHTAANGDWYMYTGPVGGTIVQFKLRKDGAGRTTYKFRTYLTGVSITTGLGVADDQKSLMVFTDPSAVGAAGQEVVTKLPLCEDMP